MLNDVHAPIENEKQDILGRSLLAGRIYDRLCGETCPQAIGIYGGWGTGKTSLLNLLVEKWKRMENKLIQIVYIDAWQYEATGNLLVPVIVALKELSGDNSFLKGSWNSYARRVLVVTGLSLAGGFLNYFTSTKLGDLKSIFDDVEKREGQNPSGILLDWERLADEIKNTQCAFQKLIEAVVQEKRCSRIVFCIDNLDRCSPDRTVNLLESVKNFLSVFDCTWLFAMDSDIIASYINQKYKDTAMDGYSFLDKIIPEQYHLSFFPEEHDPRIFDLIRSATGRDITLNNWKRLPLLPNVMVPRRLKKSAVKFAECFSSGNSLDANRDTVFLLSLLYHSWPDFYERLSSNSDEHIGRLLANFFKVKTTDGPKWGEYYPLPLDGKFSDEQDLILFLQTAFPDAMKHPTDVVLDIQLAISALRRVGLP